MNRVRLRPEIEAMVAYDAGPQAADGAFLLAGNENPFDPLPNVLEAVRAAPFSRYPDAAARNLRTALARRHHVPLESVHVSAGSVSIIYELIRALAGPGDEVVMSWRSFEAYPKAVTVAGATGVTVANTPDGGHDLVAMAAAVTERSRLILVCSPNNPTGAVVAHEDFVAFMDAVPPTVVVAIDEAYVEYVRDPDAVRSTDLVSRYSNLVILRTFSKAYGLAGLRVGYALGAPALLRAVRSTALPFAVTEVGQAAALASLDSEDALNERVDRIVGLRTLVVSALRAQGWNVPEPGGNFVWIPTGRATLDAAALYRSRGMLVRAFPPDGIRITIAEEASIRPLIDASREVADQVLVGEAVASPSA
jgi:histidinol-phosphate aminotransferase